MLTLGGPAGISPQDRKQLHNALDPYIDAPLLGVSLPGGITHSNYALATMLVFHDQECCCPSKRAWAMPARWLKQY